MATRTPFAPGEWYHCYNRGVDKRVTFETEEDYKRFLEVLYVCNTSEKIHRSDLVSISLEAIFTIPRNKPLVEIGAFSLMPNHFHILIKEIESKGITTFMQKVGTAYTMYFNIKSKRTGNLFMKPFRSRHIRDDAYFQHVINYIHCNPAELYEYGWKNGIVKDMQLLNKELLAYPYSSFGAHKNIAHPLRPILSENSFGPMYQTPPRQMLEEAREYYSTSGKATP